jgi:hypothetical protein
MASPIDICNIGLTWLGANFITGFTDGTTESQLCQLQYDSLRRAVLEDRAWTFATRTVQLSSGVPADPIPPQWAWAFLVPADCIRLVKLFQPTSNSPRVALSSDPSDGNGTIPVPFERLKDYAYTNSGPTVWGKYITDVTDTTKFAPSFVQALAARIAQDLAMPITNNANLQAQMVKLYMEKLQAASSTEGQQGTAQRIQARTLADRRW